MKYCYLIIKEVYIDSVTTKDGGVQISLSKSRIIPYWQNTH